MAGAGEDISFDIEPTKRWHCHILILDPTPRAIAHFEATKVAVADRQPAPINHSPGEFYEARPEEFSRLTFHAWGLWHKNSSQRFLAPTNPQHISHSIGELDQVGEGFDAECVTLMEALKRVGRSSVDILKLDIEGAEFEVLEDMILKDLRPKYLLVEFHPGQCDIERRLKQKTMAMLRRLYDVDYRLVKNRDWDYVLERHQC